jgi:hypothetical protein
MLARDPRLRPGGLLHRARQWLAARERLVAAWRARCRVKRAARLQQPAHSASKIGLPQWWEYESPLKRHLALEVLLRKIFALVPEPMGG